MYICEECGVRLDEDDVHDIKIRMDELAYYCEDCCPECNSDEDELSNAAAYEIADAETAAYLKEKQ